MSDNKFENGYALIVGVDQHQIARLALPTVAKDVQALFALLTDPARCGYLSENVKLVTGQEATQDNIFDGLSWLNDKIKADPNATAFVYYSGHGMVDKKADVYYLVPFDIARMSDLRRKAIRADVFSAEIADLTPQRLVVILDCCHAEGMEVKDVALDDDFEIDNFDVQPFPVSDAVEKAVPSFDPEAKDVDLLATGAGRAILNSCKPSEKSYIRRDGQMSVFTYHLIEALTGHAEPKAGATEVLITDVMGYVQRKVPVTAQAMNKQQTPVARTEGVFPVALLLGGKGFDKSVPLQDPLAAPAAAQPTSGSTVFNQEGQTVHGDQTNIGRVESIGHIGRRTVTTTITDSEGVIVGDHGSITINNNAPALDAATLARLFQPLTAQIAAIDSAETREVVTAKIETLKTEVEKEESADDTTVATLIDEITTAAPSLVEEVVNLFTSSAIAKVAGAATKFMIGRLKPQAS